MIYECTVEGDVGATLWNGSVFDCPETGNELTLIHIRKFTNTLKGCNNGAILGHGVCVVENSYTSQINITVDYSMDGKSVTCFYDNGTSIMFIGNSSLMVTTGILFMLYKS